MVLDTVEDREIVVKFYSTLSGTGTSPTSPPTEESAMSVTVDRKKTTVKQLKELILKDMGLELAIPIGLYPS